MNNRNPKLQFTIIVIIGLVAFTLFRVWYNMHVSENNCVANYYMRVYAGPGSNFDDMWILVDGDRFIYTGVKSDDWFEVQTATGVTGWIDDLTATKGRVVCDQFQLRKSVPTVNPYADCISWQEVKYHYGERVCVYGKIIAVDSEYVTYGCGTYDCLWSYAFFSTANDTFHLTSPDLLLDAFQGKCVVVRGELTDKDDSKNVPRMPISPPSELSAHPSRGFGIGEGPAWLCP